MQIDPYTRAEEARERLEKWRAILSGANTGRNKYTDEILAELLGSSAVATMAELESFMRDLVDSISSAINDAHCPITSLCSELHILHAHSKFSSIQDLRINSRKYWSSRLEITRLHISNEIASLPRAADESPQPPLRGSTINIRSISEVAEVFCFPHKNSLISGHQQGSLHKLHGQRNDFAHATVPPLTLFPDPHKAIVDTLNDINNILDVLYTLAEEWDSVIVQKLFLKSSHRRILSNSADSNI